MRYVLPYITAYMANYNSIVFFIVVACIHNGAAGLSRNHYKSTCPQALPTIKAAVQAAVNNEKRMGASLLRLHFHDCFVNGCDASLLLDDTANFTGEKTASPNANSVRGFDVIDAIKAQVEKLCPRIVSCADIVAVAARDSVVALGGPTWKVRLGRRDSTTANLTAANTDIPPPTSNITTLLNRYANKGLSAQDLVALSGAHTIGLARCVLFRDRLYNDSDIDPSFSNSLKAGCPRVGNNDTLFPLDVVSPTVFDNNYFKNLLSKKGLLHSDQVLFNSTATSPIVSKYNLNPAKFFNDFKTAMIRMGNIAPLTGKNGEIRVNCRKIN